MRLTRESRTPNVERRASSLLPVLLAVGCWLSAVSGQWLERVVYVPDTMGTMSGPRRLTTNPATGRIYLSSASPVVVFDPLTLTKVRKFPASGDPYYCSGAGKLYLVDSVMFRVDASADTLLDSVFLPYAPASAAYSSGSNRLYLIGPGNRDPVLSFDPSGGTVVRAINTGYENQVLTWDSTFDRVYVGLRSHAGLVAVIDCPLDSLVGYVRTGLRETRHLVVATRQDKLYCSGTSDSTGADAMVVVDTDSLQAIGQVPDAPIPGAALYNSVTDRLCCRWGDSLYTVDCTADTVRRRLYLSEGDVIACLCFSPLSGKTYVSTDGHVAVTDTCDSVVNYIDIPEELGYQPHLLGFSAEHSLLSCAMPNYYVLLVDGAADTIVGLLDYASYAIRGMVFNPAGSKLYLLCASRDVVLVLDREYRVTARIPLGVTDNYAIPVLNPALNQLLVADRDWLRVIDCNTDVLLDTLHTGGIRRPMPVLHPDLNRLYVFPRAASSSDRRVWVYDCLRGMLIDTVSLGTEVPSAVLHPRSNRIYFCRESGDGLGVLDPVNNTVVRTLQLEDTGNRGRVLANTEDGLLYFANDGANMLYTIDVALDSIIRSDTLPADAESLFWHHRLRKLYVVRYSTSGGYAYIYDPGADTVFRQLLTNVANAGLLNERNDKLYLGIDTGIAVVDCRYDSVVALLPGVSAPYYAAWNQAANRMFFARRSNTVAVYADSLLGLAETGELSRPEMLLACSNPARGSQKFTCRVPVGGGWLSIYDAVGRELHRQAVPGQETEPVVFWPGTDRTGRKVPAGVYFARLESGSGHAVAKVVLQ